MTIWRSLLHYGVAANSNSTTVSRGVYSWGTINQLYPDSLSLDYIPSTGSTGNTVKIGLVYPVGQTLLVGWQDGTAYGCDQINFNNPAASHGYIKSLVQDLGMMWHQQAVMKIRADYKPLLTGESIQLGYYLDRGSLVQMASSDSQIGDKSCFLQISKGRNQEYQLQIDLYSSSGTSPTLLSMSAMVDEFKEEQAY
jgi:hypothetical protein